VPDPIRVREPFPERRKRLGDAGKKLAPGSGVKCPDPAKPGPCENGHVETVLWRDVAVGVPSRSASRAKRVRTRFTPSRLLRRSNWPQRNAAVAFNGRYGAIAYEEERSTKDAVWVATTADGGRHWSHPVHPEPRGPGVENEQWPAVAVSSKGVVTVAWTDDTGGVPHVVFMRSRPRARWAPSTRKSLDPSRPAADVQWKPALAQGAGDVVHAAFVDTRARSADGGLPQAGIYYTRITGGVPAEPKRMDEGPPDAPAAKLDNAWSPALAVRGDNVLLTWLDFMHYDWDVLSRLSHDGGRAFDKQVDSNREPADVEDLSDSPRPLLLKGGPLIAWTDFHKRDSSAKAPHEMYDIYAAPPGKEPVQADPYGTKQVSTFWPSACERGSDALIAFQDSSTGVARIRVTRLRAGTKRGRAFPVSDTKANAYRPAIGCTKTRLIATWEDTRNGPPQIRVASAPLRRIR
jgi:hypothetical protein